MQLIKKYKWEIISFCLVFLITCLFPYSGDDFSWMSINFDSTLLEKLMYDSSINGRYLGNFLAILMCKNIIARGIIMSLTLTAIVYLLHRETKFSRIFIWLMFLLMPLEIFRQVIPWTSGFTNYVISTLFLLIILILLNKIYYKKSVLLTILSIIVIFLGTFFIENLSVFLIIATFILNVLYIIKNKKVNVGLILTLVGSILGTLLMLSHPAYQNVVDGVDGYRSFANGITGIIVNSYENFSGTIYRYTAFENIFLIITLVTLLFVYYKKNKSDYKNKKRKFLNITFIYSYTYIIYIIIANFNKDWKILLNYTSAFESLITIVFLILLLINIMILFHKSKNFKKIITVIMTIILLIAPLLIVNPIGARNFFMIYTLEILLIIYIFKETEIKITKQIKYLGGLTLLIACVYYISIYSVILKVSLERDEYIKNMSENTNEVYLNVPRLPYENYVWTPDFNGIYLSNVYKNSKKIRPEIQFNFIDYTSWKNMENQ